MFQTQASHLIWFPFFILIYNNNNFALAYLLEIHERDITFLSNRVQQFFVLELLIEELISYFSLLELLELFSVCLSVRIILVDHCGAVMICCRTPELVLAVCCY